MRYWRRSMQRGTHSSFLSIAFLIPWILLFLAPVLSAQTTPPSGCLMPDWTTPVLNMPLVPDHAQPGAPGFTMTINGTGLGNGFGVAGDAYWNSVLLTTAGHWSQAIATVPASLLAQAGTVAVTVHTVSPSLPQYFYIAAPHKISSGSWIRADHLMGSLPERQVVADLNNDGNLDIISADSSNNEVVVMLGKGNGTFLLPKAFPTGSAPAGLAVADFNEDGNLDIATANY